MINLTANNTTLFIYETGTMDNIDENIQNVILSVHIVK